MKHTKPMLALALCVASNISQAAELEELDTTQVKTKSQQEKQVISELIIQQKLVNNLDDLVRDVPGVVIKSSDSRWGDTGFNIRGVSDDRVAVSIDGLAQGESLQYEGGQAYGYFKGGRNGIELESVKAVTITKGADSVISGSGALGGSVAYVTKEPSDLLNTTGNDWAAKMTSAYLSRNQEKMLSFSTAARFDQLEALAIVTQRDGDEFDNHTAGADIDGSARGRPDEQDRDQSNLLLKFNYHLSDSNNIGLIFEDNEKNIKTDVKSYNGPWYVGRIGDDTSSRRRLGLFQSIQLDTSLFDSLEWSLDSQSVDFEAITAQSVTFYGGLTPRVDTRSFDQAMKKFRLDFTKSVAGDSIEHQLTYGLAVENKEVENSQLRSQTKAGEATVHSTNQALVPKSDIDNYNVYFLDQISLSDATQVELGIRYDNYEYAASSDANFADNLGGSLGDQSFDFISGALGITQALNEHYKVTAKIGRGFRAPTIENLYTRSGTEDDWATGANPALDVETSTNIELTLAGNFENGRYSVTPFYNKYKNFIESTPRTRLNDAGVVDDYSIYANVGSATTKGVEFSASLDLHKSFGLFDGLSTNFSAAYARGEQEDGAPLTSIQPFTATLGVVYRSADNRWGMNGGLTYTAEKKASDAYSIDSDGIRQERDYLSNAASVLDVTGFYKFSDDLTLRAGIYNLTDKEYYTWNGIRFVGRDDLRPGVGVTGEGINRFTETGRNFSFRLDYTL